MHGQDKKQPESYDKLNTVSVPLTALRFALAKLVQEGYTEYPLGDLLTLIHSVTVESLEDKAE